MKIAIDLRSLQTGSISGVENYALNLVERLLETDKANSYVLFYNSFSHVELKDLNFVNAKTVKTNYPNKLLNLLFKLKIISLEDLIGPFDLLFMPNLNVINLAEKTRLVVTVHDLSFMKFPEFYDLKRRIWHKFLGLNQLFKRADMLLAVSKYTKLDLEKIFAMPESKIKVVYPGVDDKSFPFDIPLEKLRMTRNKYGLPGEFFLFLNTLEPRKNLVNLVKAFEGLNSKKHLVIAGKKGWKIRSILKKIAHSPKKNEIHYLGYIDEADKPYLIKMATALLYPSYYEGFGFHALEAMSVGTPVLASQVTSLPEVLCDAALLVNPYSERDLRAAMEILEKDEILRSSLVLKGQERVRGFNWENSVRQVLTHFQTLNAQPCA